MPVLTPVDGDPFTAAPKPRAPVLTPVAGDPFAAPAPKPVGDFFSRQTNPLAPNPRPTPRPTMPGLDMSTGIPAYTPKPRSRSAAEYMMSPTSDDIQQGKAFVHAAERATIPSVGGAAGFTAGASLAGSGLTATGIDAGGPWGWAAHGAGTLVGGLLGAVLGGTVTDYGQEKALQATPESWKATIGQDTATRQREHAEHPMAEFAGGLVPQVLTMRPGLSPNLITAPSKNALARLFASPVTARAAGATLGAGQEVAREYISGEKLDPTKIGLATAFGLTLNRPTKLGAKIFGLPTATRDMFADSTFARSRAAAADPSSLKSANPDFQPSAEPAVAEPAVAEPVVRPNQPVKIVPVEGDPFHPPAPARAAPAPPVVAPLPVPTAPPTGDGGDGQGTAPTETAPLRPEPGDVAEGERLVRTPAGANVRTRMGVVDASQLTQAEGDNQNRDRSRDTTALQVQDIISKFDPEQLHEDPSSDRGAPIIGPDGAIDSGNGRVLTLNKIYDAHPELADKYRKMIESRGFDTTGMERPVLVQHRMTDMTPEQRRQFVIDSNKDTKLELSPVEKAKSDADSITPEMLASYAGGDLNSTANAGFVQKFNSQLTTGEMGGMIGEDRRLTPTGQQRIENAVVAHAYGEPKLLARMMESSHDEIRSITGSLADVAGPWARLRAAVKDGEIDQSYDVTKQLTDAAARVADARARGIKPADMLTQQDAFDPMDPVTEEFIRAFHNTAMTRTASRKAVSAFLHDYVAEASSQDATPGLFGEVELKSPVDIAKGLLEQRDNPNGTETLLDAIEPKEKTNDPQGTPRRNEVSDAGEAQEEARQGREGRAGSGGRQGRADGIVEDKGGYTTTFNEASFTNRQSVYDSAIRAIGLTPDKFNVLPPARKFALLSKALEKLTGIVAVRAENMPLLHAIDQLLDAHQTLQGMASVLGVVPKVLSLDGALKLRLVKSARFLGSYQPGSSLITLPGRSNSFGHEWAHALDYHLLNLVGGDDMASGLTGHVRSEGADFTPVTVREAFVNVLNTMFFDGSGIALKIMKLQRTIELTKSDKQKVALQRQIDNLLTGRSRAAEKSRYWKGADALNKTSGAGDYWTKPTEMFARAFEAFLGFKMDNEGFGSEFVNKGNEAYLSDVEERFSLSFPKGGERIAIFDALQKLMDTLNAEQVLKASGGAEATVRGAMDFDETATPAAKAQLDATQRKTRGIIGKLLGPDIEAWQIARENARIDKEDAARRAPDMVGLLSKANNARSLAFSAASDGVKMIAVRWKSRAAQTIHDHFATDLGGSRHVTRVWSEAVTLRENQALNPVFAELEKHGSAGWVFKKLEQGQRDTLRTLLTGKPVADDMGLTRLASLMRKAYDAEWYHNKNAGIDLGYVADAAYLNRQTDRELVAGNPDKFTAQATKVYELVFDRDIGEIGEDIAADDERLSNFLAIASKHKIDGYSELRKALRGDDVDPDEVAGMIDEMLDSVRSAYAVTAAAEYRDAILHTETFPDFTATSTLPNSEKRRTLPPEADELLKDFYNPDPVSAFMSYVRSSVRRTEWARRFGPSGEIGKKLDSQMASDGVPASERAYVWALVERMSGRYRRTGFLAHPAVAGTLSFLRVKGTLAMMGRAVTLSFFEPTSLGIVTGRPLDGLKAVAKTWANVLHKGTRAETMEWARAQGFIKHHMLEQLSAMDRFGTTSDVASKLDKLPAVMFRNTGLTFLTDASDAAVVDVGRRGTLVEMAHRIANGGARGKEAATLARELGVRDPAEFARQLIEMNGAMPSDEWLAGPEGYDYNTALVRLAKMTIQKPDAADLAPLGRNPLASYATYSITAFLQASYRHLLKRNVKIGLRIAKSAIRKDAEAGEAALLGRYIIGALLSVATLYGLNLLSSVAREYLFNADRQDEWEKDGNWLRNNMLLAASRTFSFGAMDPVINTVTGLKYNRDLAYVPLGAYAGNDAQNATKIAKMFVVNSRKTNSAESNAIQGLYGLAIAPAIAAGASLAPGGPFASAAGGVLTSTSTSPQAGKAFAGLIVGEKDGTKTKAKDKTPTAYDKFLDAYFPKPAKPEK